ncbi:PREDICTED: probable elongation factor 1-beta isoform X2 [Nicrophorus vespilloides]|uniref:Probable elongation factor 1-beta isoform X2 n=1 Tax=Nicrophorus vespilloides TaxID=110193 RepID=A0ABM1N4D7_NICVS|nr:PREDICTED: probable elongation factor 1-beta isoform X2 [Nicrophorus vespilloides]
MAAQNLALDSFWVDKSKFDESEIQYFERLGSALLTPLADEVAKARQRLIEIRENMDDGVSTMGLMENETMMFIEKKMSEFSNMILNIQNQMMKFNERLVSMESMMGSKTESCPMVCPKAQVCKKAAPVEEEDDDDVDLFDSDSEDDEVAAKLKEDRLSAYNAKKSKKPALIAKSSIILDVKPWDDETDMKLLEGEVRKIVMDGMLWGASKLVPLAYGIHKLQINCVVEDEKVSIDALQEQIESIEDYVQSVDIAAFNKI